MLSVESDIWKKLFKEATDTTVKVTEFKVETVKAAVEYCYAQDISDFLEVIENAIELLKFADKYDFQTLKVGFFRYQSNRSSTPGWSIPTFYSTSPKMRPRILCASMSRETMGLRL